MENMDRTEHKKLIQFLADEYLSGYKSEDLEALLELYLAVLSAPIGPDELNAAGRETLSAYYELMEPAEGIKSMLETCRKLQNSEPVFRKLLYMVKPERYYAISNQKKGFSAILAALGLDSRAARAYEPQVTRTYKLRMEAAHGKTAKQGTAFDQLSNFQNIMVAILLAVDLNQTGLIKRLAEMSGEEETFSEHEAEDIASDIIEAQQSAAESVGAEAAGGEENTQPDLADAAAADEAQSETGAKDQSETQAETDGEMQNGETDAKETALPDEADAKRHEQAVVKENASDADVPRREESRRKEQDDPARVRAHSSEYEEIPAELGGIIRLANGGDPVSQYRLAVYYFDRGEAASANFYLTKAAASQLPDALYLLGFMHETGQQAEKNYRKALACYQQAAEYGSVDAIYRLGRLYVKGLGTRRDRKKGLELIQRAAISGCAKAQWRLGRRNESLGDLEEAAKWYEKAVRQSGDAQKLWLGRWFAKQGKREKAAAWLGECLYAETPALCRKAGGELAKLGETEAAETCFRRAAMESAEDALCFAERLAAGQGIPQDKDESLEWYQHAAEFGNIHAHSVFQALLRQLNYEGTSAPLSTEEVAKAGRAAVPVNSSQATASQFFTTGTKKTVFAGADKKNDKKKNERKSKNAKDLSPVAKRLSELTERFLPKKK